MSFSVGIIGLPNAGKSTLFKALTRNQVEIAPYPFTTIQPNVGIVAVPDERLEKIAQIIKPEKTTPTTIEFVDIAGLVRGAHRGEGLGNQFLAHIKTCDAILEVVRVFEDPHIEHIEGRIDPQRDIEIIKAELLMKDLEMTEKAITKLEKDIRTKDKKSLKKWELMKEIKEEISRGKQVLEINLPQEKKEELKEFQFLTAKPVVYVFNFNDNQNSRLNLRESQIGLNLKLEEEITEFEENEIKELKLNSQLDRLIIACYNILDLITFYTVRGGKETKAWTLKRGLTCPRAGGIVHSDFENKFIRAEVISWEDLIKEGAWHNAKEKGQIKTVGKEYVVKDGDVIEFKI